MNHEDASELLGAYALNAVEPDEAEGVRQHVAECPRCRDEVTQHQQTAAMLASTGGEAPPAIWDAIAAKVVPPPGDSARPVPPMRRRSQGAELPRKSRMRLPTVGGVLVGVAAAAAIGVLAVRVADLDHRLNHVTAQGATVSAAAQNALLDPNGRRVVLTGTGGAHPLAAEVVILPSGSAFLLNRGLATLPAGETYQLWSLSGAKPVSLGLLGGDPGTVAFSAAPPETSSAFAVSVEPASGSVAPTGTPVAESPA